ncbi:hypothetical protein [Nocardia acidivorans]|uniref:hypothetical protein n=1 Tax=Nocardia acidivorans TaxID=404580 RepID=UPI000AD2CB20|nr:hypothetical protein [Nocardia acidivorans]
MDKQTSISLVAALAGPLATALGPLLVYRVSRRDDREDLKRDLERYNAMPEDLPERAMLAAHIGKRERDLIELEPARRRARAAITFFLIAFGGLTALGVVRVRSHWPYYLITVGMWALLAMTLVALGGMVVYGQAAGVSLYKARPFMMEAALYLPLTLILGITWVLVAALNLVRRLFGRQPLRWVPLRQLWRVFLPTASGSSG